MKAKNEATVLLLSKDDIDALTKAVNEVSTMLWRTRYRREITLPLPKEGKAAAVVPLGQMPKITSASADDDLF